MTERYSTERVVLGVKVSKDAGRLPRHDAETHILVARITDDMVPVSDVHRGFYTVKTYDPSDEAFAFQLEVWTKACLTGGKFGSDANVLMFVRAATTQEVKDDIYK